MNINHDQLESLARMLCESRPEDKGRYDRKGCKRNHWRRKAVALHTRVNSAPQLHALCRSWGWPV